MAAADYIQVAQQLYLAYFGRPADRSGLINMTNALNAAGAPTTAQGIADAYQQNTNATVVAILNNFGASDESKALYGSGTDTQFIAAVYQQVLNRLPDLEGLDFWTAALGNGSMTRANAATQIIAAALKDGGDATDAATVSNKVTVSTNFTAAIDTVPEIIGYSGDAAAAQARALIQAVTDTTDTAAYQATVEAVLDSIANPVVPGVTLTLTTAVDSGTTFTGGTGDDTFNADQSSGGANTLNTLDKLTGGAGTDTLNVILNGTSVTPASLAGIEIINLTSAGGSLGLDNAAGVTSVTNASSTAATEVSGIAAGAAVNVSNTTFGTTFKYATTSGTEAAALGVNAVTTAANITINGVETITTTATGSASSYTLDADAATTLNFAGDVAQTVALGAGVVNVTKFDASAATAGVTLTTVDQTGIIGAGAVTVLGGSGNDSLTLVESNDLNVNAGAGNDTVTIAAIDLADTVNGGDGNDTLVTVAAQVNALDAATPTTRIITGFESLTVTDTFDGTLNVANIDSGITKVTLGNRDAGATRIVTGDNDTVVGAAGAFAVDLGRSLAANASVLDGALVVSDTGTADTDSLTISNKAINSTTTFNLNVFNGKAITSAGYEALTVNTGTVAGSADQTIGTLTINSDVVASNVSLTVTGVNQLDITSVVTNSTGLLTIDASAMTVQSTGNTFVVAGTTSATGGTQNITGSAGNDSITIGNFASTISGGAGNDNIVGGTAIDSISGGTGNDTINGSGGNDVLLGGEGDDTITAGAGSVNVDAGAGDDTVNLGSDATSGDTIVGGEGDDTLVVSAAISTGTVGARISGFENLSTTATAQVMSNFVNNTFTTVVQAAGGNGTLAITNAGSTLNALVSEEADALVTSFSRLADGTADSLTVTAGAAIIAGSALTASGEETITIDASDFGVDLDLITATSLTSLTVKGDNALVIDAQGATNLATVNASGVTGTATVSVDASDSTKAITFTGGTTTGTTTLVTGSGADVITAGEGTGALDVTSGNGNDTITGNAGNDTIVSGGGADSIVAGLGADSITAGSGNDAIVLTETTASSDVVVLTHTGLDTITGFATGASGDQLEFSLAALETAYNIDFVNLDDGASTADTDGLIQEVTADVAAVANATFFVLRGASFDTTDDVENALETGDFEISHAGGAEGDGFLVVYSDGTDTFVAVVRDNVATSATDFTAGELTVTNIAKLVGNSSISASEFNIANFDFIA